MGRERACGGSCTGSPWNGGQKSSDTMVVLYLVSSGLTSCTAALMRFDEATSYTQTQTCTQ